MIKPVISSPGTGVQHLANFTSTSSIPETSIALLLRLADATPVDGVAIVGSGCESSTVIVATSFSTIEAAETCPSPTAA
ncbi:unannotated protein [freshwater metagenome]|uniref:Unannotated protein n=1 Tax=freshwater metagenome TaxID=449393 RepID=A0A6J6LE10_9ZZZZ